MDKKEKKEKKGQRIRLRLYNHAVKFDGEVVELAPDGAWFVVKFDGPLDDLKLWRYGEILLTDKQPVDGALQFGARIWEAL